MVLYRRRYGRKRRAPSNRVRRGPRNRLYRVRRKALNQSQVFTETFIPPALTMPGVDADGYITLTNPALQQLGKFQVNIGAIPQIAQYSQLYTQYKILKAQVILMPSWGAEDFNMAEVSQSGGRAATETARIVYAINDDAADTLPPGTEMQVLEDNGCKIRQLTNPLKISFRPKPVLTMSNPFTGGASAVQPKYSSWLAFDGDGKNINHVGVDWCITKYSSFPGPDPAFVHLAQVYVKLTFVCKDPR